MLSAASTRHWPSAVIRHVSRRDSGQRPAARPSRRDGNEVAVEYMVIVVVDHHHQQHGWRGGVDVRWVAAQSVEERAASANGRHWHWQPWDELVAHTQEGWPLARVKGQMGSMNTHWFAAPPPFHAAEHSPSASQAAAGRCALLLWFSGGGPEAACAGT